MPGVILMQLGSNGGVSGDIGNVRYLFFVPTRARAKYWLSFDRPSAALVEQGDGSIITDYTACYALRHTMVAIRYHLVLQYSILRSI